MTALYAGEIPVEQVTKHFQLEPNGGAETAFYFVGAGDGNRTHVRSLGSFYTAIVRRPLIPVVR